MYLTYLEDVAIEPPVLSTSHNDTDRPQLPFGASNDAAQQAMAIFDDFFPSYYTADNVSATPTLRYKNYMDGPSQDEMVAWKISVMPALIYSLPREVQQGLKAPHAPQRKAQKVKISLQPELGWKSRVILSLPLHGGVVPIINHLQVGSEYLE